MRCFQMRVSDRRSQKSYFSYRSLQRPPQDQNLYRIRPQHLSIIHGMFEIGYIKVDCITDFTSASYTHSRPSNKDNWPALYRIVYNRL